MGEELKPCRRCGLGVTPDGIEVTQTDTGTYTARFECPDCGEVAETCMRHSSEDFAVADVIDDWNRRWTDPALTARIEELEAGRDQLRKALWGLMQAVDGCLTPHEALLWKQCEEAMKGAGDVEKDS
jgi:hypothetical protein